MKIFILGKDIRGNWNDYESAVSSKLQLVSEGNANSTLEANHENMVSDGMLLNNGEIYNDLMRRRIESEERDGSFFRLV